MSNDGQLLSDFEMYAAVTSRNQLRTRAGLPPVDLPQELGRLHQARKRRAFEGWMQSPLRFRVEEKLLLRTRRQIKNPMWTPTGGLSGGGWAFHVALIKQMQKLGMRLGAYFLPVVGPRSIGFVL